MRIRLVSPALICIVWSGPNLSHISSCPPLFFCLSLFYPWCCADIHTCWKPCVRFVFCSSWFWSRLKWTAAQLSPVQTLLKQIWCQRLRVFVIVDDVVDLQLPSLALKEWLFLFMFMSWSGFMASGFCWIKLASFISEENIFLGWFYPHPAAEIMQSVSFYPPHMNQKK